MATKNIVPRADNEGSLGTDAKRWATAKIVTVTGNLVGAVTGNADTATTLTGVLSKTLGGAGDVTGILKANGSGTVSAAAGSDLLSTHGTQTANTVLAGPTTGAATNPTFRALVAADLGTGLTLQSAKLGLGAAAGNYMLNIAPTSGATAGSTVFIQDATATTGKTNVVIRAGAASSNSEYMLNIQDGSGGDYGGWNGWGQLALKAPFSASATATITTAAQTAVALTLQATHATTTGNLLNLKDKDGNIKASIGSLTAPASVAGNGTAATTALAVTGAAGGASSGTTGQTGGAGASIQLTGGAGGAVAGAGGIGGAGGDITLTPGAGGVGASANGRTGKVVITIANVPDYANNAAAVAGGLTNGMLYRNGDILMIVHS